MRWSVSFWVDIVNSICNIGIETIGNLNGASFKCLRIEFTHRKRNWTKAEHYIIYTIRTPRFTNETVPMIEEYALK